MATRLDSLKMALEVEIYLHFPTLFLPGYKVGRFHRHQRMGSREFTYSRLAYWISLSFQRSKSNYIIYNLGYQRKITI